MKDEVRWGNDRNQFPPGVSEFVHLMIIERFVDCQVFPFHDGPRLLLLPIACDR
ncbi:hypothetical protein [Agrobacterium radiobacter]|uniref:hypothetical protein n=1 Tax=Agrobacterium radiobacter TaxID=362 RepID=UPI003CE584BC